MKALSVRQPYADRIINGTKKTEYRTWKTKYRGPLLICSSKKSDGSDRLCGYALGTVILQDVRESADCYRWVLVNPKPLSKPFPVKGKLHLYEVRLPSKTRSKTRNGQR